MIVVALGIAVLIAGIVGIFCFNNPLGVLFILISGVIVVAGLSPISGYEEPVLEEQYELKVMVEPNIYVVQDSNGTVTCKHRVKSEHPEAVESYGKYTYHTNIEIVHTEKGTKPIMKKYLIKAKKTIWTFAMESDEYKYVFYVPEENIEKWQNVHVD